MTDPKNTSPTNTSKPSETLQKSLPENSEPAAQNPPSAGNEEPSADTKQPAATNKEPSVTDKQTSEEANQSSNEQQTPTISKTEQTPPKKMSQSGRTGNAPPPQQKSSQARFALFISFITLLLLAAGSVYFWQTQTHLTAQLEQLGEQSRSDLQNVEASQQSIQQRFGKLDDRLFAQQNDVAQLTRQIAFNTQKLTDLGARSRMDWLLAEAEYLMRLANQRLNLEHDMQSAEAMLSTADSILAEINDPGLSEIRKTLANEILSLQQVRHLDRQGLYFKLEALVQNIDGIKQQAFLNQEADSVGAAVSDPGTTDNTADAATENSFLSLWRSIWRDLKQVVTIRRLDQPLPPLLAPEQHYYLKQNLRLMLEQASLALLDENSAVYQASLKKADAWLKQYFMQNDPLVAQIQTTLNELAAYEISLTLPDISHSLRLTKAKIESFYRQHSLNKLNSPNTESQTEHKQAAESQQPLPAEGASL